MGFSAHTLVVRRLPFCEAELEGLRDADERLDETLCRPLLRGALNEAVDAVYGRLSPGSTLCLDLDDGGAYVLLVPLPSCAYSWYDIFFLSKPLPSPNVVLFDF